MYEVTLTKLSPEFHLNTVAALLAGKTKYSKGTFNHDGPDPFLTNETQQRMDKKVNTNILNFPSDSQCGSESL